MRKILFVGCGGSGGAVLGYLMDQLRSDLSRHGIKELPGGWQFVQIDVPTTPDQVAGGLGSVVDQGGRYVSCAPTTPKYSLVDAGVSQSVSGNGGLAQMGTWASREPQSESVPVQAGAGQLRAIGRMLTLSRMPKIHEELSAAWSRMSLTESTEQMRRVAATVPGIGSFAPADPPLVIVASSMAGGSGASMALDVCRILNVIPGVDPQLMAVFMASADVFEEIPAYQRQGIRPNALAMLGEIVACQTGAAREHDAAILSSLGLAAGAGSEIPFARVFPIGRSVGLSGGNILFGDGSMGAVYRGIGRALAALVSSGSALQAYVSYDLGNPAPVPTRTALFGWGAAHPENLQWGAFGYASLSMGRDRYGEYAAQRLARSAVDHLLDGHLQPGNNAGGDQQARSLVDSQWITVCRALELPSGKAGDIGDELRTWLYEQAMTRQQNASLAKQVVDAELVGRLPTLPGGTQAPQIISAIQSAVGQARNGMRAGIQRVAYADAYEWTDRLCLRLEAVLAEAIAAHGLPYAQALLMRLAHHLENQVVPTLEEWGQSGRVDVSTPPGPVASMLQSLKGVVAQTQTVIDETLKGYSTQVGTQVRAEWCALMAPVLRSMNAGVIAAMTSTISESLRLLENARADETPHTGVARLETDAYPMWPSDDDVAVAARWSEAQNEVLITPSTSFMAQYDSDLRASLPDDAQQGIDHRATRRSVVRSVVRGMWPTTGGERPPGGLVLRMSTWHPKEFATDPSTNDALVPASARYDLTVRPHQLLARSRMYVGRPEESFLRYIRMSLREHAVGQDIPESGLLARQQGLESKFRQALSMALPLISVDNTAAQTLHNAGGVSYRYKFSSIPLRRVGTVEAAFERAIDDDAMIDPGSGANFEAALDESDVTRIDIFGSYQNFAPLVFDGVLRPIAQQWRGTNGTTEREQFWRLRRTRPLSASLPMSPVERTTMVAGWFLGQVIGAIKIPAAPYDQPVQVWDAASSEWVMFPHPLLTPPSAFNRPYDWLPAVLESSLLAMTNFGDQPVGSSMRPYGVLRGLFDGGVDGPTNVGMLQRVGEVSLQTWIDTGAVPPGGQSRVPGLTAANTSDDRRAGAKKWLTNISTIAGTEYMPAGMAGAPGGGEFSHVRDRSVAAQMPIFADLAPDIWGATRMLTEMLDAPVLATDVF